MNKFKNRYDAGQQLARELEVYAHQPETIVLALPRGGVPVGYEIAKALALPLDIFIVRKLGVPGHEELAFGAMSMDGAIIYNPDIIQELNLSQDRIDRVIHAEAAEIKRRELTYRNNRPFPIAQYKNIILVDDGMATGATMRAAVSALQQYHPAAIIIAVPVAATATCEELKPLVKQLICPLQPEIFYAVGQCYEDFTQTSDEEVCQLLTSLSIR